MPQSQSRISNSKNLVNNVLSDAVARGALCYNAFFDLTVPPRRLQMPRKLKLVKGAAQRSALVYGMRIFGPGEVLAVEDAQVRIAASDPARVTMHLIEGTRAQIRKQLMESIDAFFELLDEEPVR
jgi:hypothetical protein